MSQRKYHLQRGTFWRFFGKPPPSRSRLAPGRGFVWARLFGFSGEDFYLELWDEELRTCITYAIPRREPLNLLWSGDDLRNPANVFLDAFCEQPEVPESFKVIVANIRWDKSY